MLKQHCLPLSNYETFLGIPKAENTSLHNIHYITCSNEMGCIDLAEGFIEDLVKLETEGIAVFDAL